MDLNLENSCAKSDDFGSESDWCKDTDDDDDALVVSIGVNFVEVFLNCNGECDSWRTAIFNTMNQFDLKLYACIVVCFVVRIYRSDENRNDPSSLTDFQFLPINFINLNSCLLEDHISFAKHWYKRRPPPNNSIRKQCLDWFSDPLMTVSTYTEKCNDVNKVPPWKLSGLHTKCWSQSCSLCELNLTMHRRFPSIKPLCHPFRD